MTAVFVWTSTSLFLMCCVLYNGCISFTNSERTVRKIELDKVCYKTCEVLVTYSSLFYTSCGWWGWSRCAKYKHGYKAKESSCSSYCPVNGGWSDYKSWSSWSSCDKSCGTGTKTRGRTRSCDNPAPKHNGKTCQGSASNTESVSCKLRECPIDGQWTSYNISSDWGACSVSCGEGTTTRVLSRSCTNPSPQYGGKDCIGGYTKTETKPCNDRECPVDGGWDTFEAAGDWGACSTTCGDGLQTRTLSRTCTNPKPKYGGKPCSGSATKTETTTCLLKYCVCGGNTCPVNGGWSSYTTKGVWSACSRTCNEGVQTLVYKRTCTNPAPQNGGLPCLGESTMNKTRSCMTIKCPEYVVMDPSNVIGTIGQVVKLNCLISPADAKWKSIKLVDKSLNKPIVDISNNGSVRLHNSRVAGSLESRADYVKAVFLFTLSRGSGVCSLVSEYTCTVEMADVNSNTITDQSSLDITAPPSNVELGVQSYYNVSNKAVQTINCTADLGITSTVSLDLQIKVNGDFVDFEAFGGPPQWTVSNIRNDDCSEKVLALYSLPFVSEKMDNSELRCKATDSKYGTTLYSNVGRIIVKI